MNQAHEYEIIGQGNGLVVYRITGPKLSVPIAGYYNGPLEKAREMLSRAVDRLNDLATGCRGMHL